MKIVFSILIITVMGIPNLVLAHSGGLNKDGCHNDRKSDNYHCHRSDNATHSQPIEKSLNPSQSSTSRQIKQALPFANCAQARAAGATPIRRGEAGYGPHLDRDNDGIGCE
jgi:hypothetical protein